MYLQYAHGQVQIEQQFISSNLSFVKIPYQRATDVHITLEVCTACIYDFI